MYLGERAFSYIDGWNEINSCSAVATWDSSKQEVCIVLDNCSNSINTFIEKIATLVEATAAFLSISDNDFRNAMPIS